MSANLSLAFLSTWLKNTEIAAGFQRAADTGGADRALISGKHFKKGLISFTAKDAEQLLWGQNKKIGLTKGQFIRGENGRLTDRNRRVFVFTTGPFGVKS